MTVPERVGARIAESAQYYEPGVYLGLKPGSDLPSVLSFYRDLSITADPAASSFVPLSAVAGRGRNPKVFAIGILPPSITRVSAAQQLDRSQTIGNDPQTEQEFRVVAEALGPPATPGSVREIVYRYAAAANLDPEKLGRVIYFESRGWNPAAVNPNGAFAGLLQFGRQFWPGIARDAGRPTVTWEEMRRMSFEEQMPFVVSYMKVRGITADSSLGAYYRAVAAPGTLGRSSDYVVYKQGSKAVKQNPAWDLNKDGEITTGEIDHVLDNRPHRWPNEPLEMKADAASATFVGGGSQNANAFHREAARATDMRVTYEKAQTSYLKSIQTALEQMANAPPLRLLVNPNSFSVKSQKIVSDGNWGRNGPIIEFWGDDQDKISGSGEVAGFYAIDALPTLGRGGPGLTRSARNVSQAWQNFQSLYLLYRNNGGMYLATQENREVLLTTVGSVYLFYDNILYIGCFDSLNVRESDEKPFRAEYDFEFTVRAAFLLDAPPDFDYGGGAAFSGGARGLDGLPTQSDATSAASLSEIAARDEGFVDSADVQATLNSATDALLAKAGELL